MMKEIKGLIIEFLKGLIKKGIGKQIKMIKYYAIGLIVATLLNTILLLYLIVRG